jgi:hypothetical protein
MEQQDYKPNSNKSKEDNPEKKKETPVISGSVIREKPTVFKKIQNVMFDKDMSDIGKYMLDSIIIPALKDGLRTVSHRMVDALFGGSGRPDDGHSKSAVSYINYGSKYGNQTPFRSSYSDSRPYNFDDIYFETFREANEVLKYLNDLIDTYRIAKIGDLYDAAKLSTRPQDFDYGWTNLKNARVEETTKGWVIRLPKAMPID